MIPPRGSILILFFVFVIFILNKDFVIAADNVAINTAIPTSKIDGVEILIPTISPSVNYSIALNGSYVPYLGATGDVDIGTHYFTAYATYSDVFGDYSENWVLANFDGANKWRLPFINNITAQRGQFGDVNVSGNITSEDFVNARIFNGQPIKGGIGSGIIQGGNYTNRGTLLVTYSGLVVSYANFTVRLETTDGLISKYYFIPNGTLTVADNSNLIYYIDTNGAIQSQTFTPYQATAISPGGAVSFLYISTHNGKVVNIQGGTPLGSMQIILQQLSSIRNNMQVISGFDFSSGTTFAFNISSGTYQYIASVASTTKQNIAIQNLTWDYHTGASTWGSTNGHILNVTTCDSGTGILPCSNPGANYRRHFIFLTGYNDTIGDFTQIHQLLPLDSLSYTSIIKCMDTSTYPITYTIPAEYVGQSVLLYAYCARRTDNGPFDTTQLINLRGYISTSASTAVDTTVFLMKDGTTPLTGDWNVGNYSITNISNENISGFLSVGGYSTPGAKVQIDSAFTTPVFILSNQGVGVNFTVSGTGTLTITPNNAMVLNGASVSMANPVCTGTFKSDTITSNGAGFVTFSQGIQFGSGGTAVTLGTAGLVVGTIQTPILAPKADSATALKITKADKSTAVVTIDTTNSNIVVVNNVTATKFIGDGSKLTSVPTYNATYAGLINNVSYLSTYNVSYDATANQWNGNYSIFAGLVNNASYLSTYNATYNAKADYQYGANNFNGSGNLTTTIINLNNIGSSPCDLTINGTICKNSTGVYIVG